jgi:hypothetical protein
MAQAAAACGGVVFLVDSRTERECLERGLGALPGGSRPLAEAATRGTPIFVYNTTTKARRTRARTRASSCVARCACWPR